MVMSPSQAEVEDAIQGLVEAATRLNSSGPTGEAARVEMLALTRRLTKTLLTPETMPFYHGLNMAELVDIRTFMKLGVLSAIPDRASISLEQLSRVTGVQESLLERMGRNLVMSGFLEQTMLDGGDYRHSKFSRAYRLEEPGPGHMFLVCYDYILKPFHNFEEYLSRRGQLHEAREPDDALHCPMTFYYNQDGTSPWNILEQDPDRMRDFQWAMTTVNHAVPVLGAFDFNRLRNSPDEDEAGRLQLVDVGGGHGTVLADILDAYPDALRPETCLLQDRPDVIELSKMNRALPDAVQRSHHDFFKEQPFKGAKAYFMRDVIHDWPDVACVQILTHLAAAMAPDSRLLICDPVLPPRVGEDNFFVTIIDHAVMAIAGKERTEKAFSDLLNKAGLELVRVWRVPEDAQAGAYVEARLKRQSARL